MQALFLNSAVDAMDPLVEQWPLALQWHSTKDGVARLTVQSQDMLNINITPSAFRCSAARLVAVVRRSCGGHVHPA